MALRNLFSVQRLQNITKLCSTGIHYNVLHKHSVTIFTKKYHNVYRSFSEAKGPPKSEPSKDATSISKESAEVDPAQSKSVPILSQLFPQTAINDPEQLQKEQKKDEEESKKEKEDSWRKMKYGFAAFGFSITMLGGFLVVEYGFPEKDPEGNIITDEFSSLPVPQQYFKRLWNAMMFYQRLIKEPSRYHLLPDSLPHPYIQPPYTLVMELTDVLVHPEWTYNTGWRFKKRPGVDIFLEQVAPPLFEIVIFTAEQGMTAFPIVDALDPNGYIMYRLVRDATHFVDGHHVKNLDNLNRDLSKVIVVDWNEQSVKFHPQNLLKLDRWKGADDDTTLIDLAAFLKTIANSEVADVREVLSYYQQFEQPLVVFRENQRKLAEQLEEEEKSKKSYTPLTTRWSSSFLKH